MIQPGLSYHCHIKHHHAIHHSPNKAKQKRDGVCMCVEKQGEEEGGGGGVMKQRLHPIDFSISTFTIIGLFYYIICLLQ